MESSIYNIYICFSEVPSELGWCGVCIKDAPPFGYGYCPPNGLMLEDDDKITRQAPKYEKNRLLRHIKLCFQGEESSTLGLLFQTL